MRLRFLFFLSFCFFFFLATRFYDCWLFLWVSCTIYEAYKPLFSTKLSLKISFTALLTFNNYFALWYWTPCPQWYSQREELPHTELQLRLFSASKYESVEDLIKHWKQEKDAEQKGKYLHLWCVVGLQRKISVLNQYHGWTHVGAKTASPKFCNV